MDDKDSVEYQPLISSPGDPEQASRPPSDADTRRETLMRRLLWFILVLEALALVAGASFLYAPDRQGKAIQSNNMVSHRALYSPAQDEIDYEVRTFNVGFVGDLTPYQAPPSDELDATWEALYKNGISSIPKWQAERLPNKTEAIAGEDGQYIVELDVFHQLRCLDTVRKAMYPDHYPTMDMGHPSIANHVNYCIDSIRQSLMCSSDIGTIVWQWVPSIRESIVKGNVAHTCRKFNKIQDWALRHTVLAKHSEHIHVQDDIIVPIYHTGSLG